MTDNKKPQNTEENQSKENIGLRAGKAVGGAALGAGKGVAGGVLGFILSRNGMAIWSVFLALCFFYNPHTWSFSMFIKEGGMDALVAMKSMDGKTTGQIVQDIAIILGFACSLTALLYYPHLAMKNFSLFWAFLTSVLVAVVLGLLAYTGVLQTMSMGALIYLGYAVFTYYIFVMYKKSRLLKKEGIGTVQDDQDDAL